MELMKTAHRILPRTLVMLFAIGFVVGCGQQSDTETKAEAETIVEAETQPASADSKESMGKATESTTETTTETQTPKPHEPHEPAKAKTVTVKIPAGMNIVISLVDALETGQIASGDEFSAVLVDPIVIGSRTVYPAGTAVTGKITNAVASGRLKTDAEMSLTLQSIADLDVQTDVIEDKAASHADRNKKLIGGGAIVGGILGALKGKDVKGAIAGAAAGAAAGTGAAALTGKKNLLYEAGTMLQFTLAESAKATVLK